MSIDKNRVEVITFLLVIFLFSCVKNNNTLQVSRNKIISEVVDTMDTVDGWESYSDIGVVVKLNSVSVKNSNALEIDYNLAKGNWCAIKKVINKNFSRFNVLRIESFSSGNKNSLEIKLEDEDGTNYGYLVDIKTNSEEIKVIEIPLKEFEYWWGGDDKLNLKKIKNIHFAVSKRQEKKDEGGKGRIVIDNIELAR